MLVVPAKFVEIVLNDPHAPAVVDPHAAVNPAPAAVVSFAIWTCSVAVPFKGREAGGVNPNEMAMGAPTIVRVTALTADGSLVTDPVMVTVFPIGTVVGAVYTEASPSPVCAGANVPQAPPVIPPVIGLPLQKTLQSTPAFCPSPTGVMLTFALAPATRDLSCPVAPPNAVTETAPARVDELPPQPTMLASRTTSDSSEQPPVRERPSTCAARGSLNFNSMQCEPLRGLEFVARVG